MYINVFTHVADSESGCTTQKRDNEQLDRENQLLEAFLLKVGMTSSVYITLEQEHLLHQCQTLNHEALVSEHYVNV